MQVGYRPQIRMPMMMPPTSMGMHQQQAQMQQILTSPITQSNLQIQNPQLGLSPNLPGQMPMMLNPTEIGFDGKMLRKTVARKTVDHNPSVVKYLEDRIWKKDCRDDRSLQADALYTQLLTLPHHSLDNPVSCVMTKFIRAALNKDPRPVFCVCWTPDGRRLITGASRGEFTLWNGLTFNFETILQAHNSSVRSMIWSHNEQWMLTGDDMGYVKYWQANMNNVKIVQGHLEAIRGLSFSPTDQKFTSCSDDRTVRIFDFVTAREESVLQGHGSDVKCVDWHPHKAVIMSGSKDSQQPIILWDAKSCKKITTIHAHKNTCTDLKWNQFNGNWLISSSRDHLCKLFDIRNLKEEVQSFRGHKKDACTVAWHPVYEKVFASGGADGSIFFWLCGAEKEIGNMEDAHDGMIWDLSWHPLGHMLVSGSNDRSTRFWTRNRPGDTFVDKVDDTVTPKADRSAGTIFKNHELPEIEKQKDGTILLPGLGLEPGMIDLLNEDYKDDSPNVSSHNLFSPNSQKNSHKQTPYFDLDDDEKRKKAPYSKPIPKEFEKAWQSNRPVNQSSSQNQPMSLMAQPLMSAPMLMQSGNKPVSLLDLNLEPAPNSNFKRKLSQDYDDYDDRNWKNQKYKDQKYNREYDDEDDDYNDDYENDYKNKRGSSSGGGGHGRNTYNDNDSNDESEYYDDRNRGYSRGRNSSRSGGGYSNRNRN